jgi:hypothetical protein
MIVSVIVLGACGSGDEPVLRVGDVRGELSGRQDHPTPEAAASAALDAWAEGGATAAARVSDIEPAETPAPPSDIAAVLRFCVPAHEVPADVDVPELGDADRTCVAVASGNETVYAGVRRVGGQWVATSLARSERGRQSQ